MRIIALLLAVLAQSTTPAPGEYKVWLETTKGPIVIAVHRDWAPRGADRFHELVTSGYYDDAPIFRIRKGSRAGTPT